MEIVELIKAEIERRIAGNIDARARVLSEILTFINSLPEDEQITYESNSGEKSTLKWQQYPSEDLEKAAEAFCDKIWNEMEFNLVYDNLYECFCAGAKWQKEQMMNYVQGKYAAYQEEYDDYYAGLRVAYGDVLKKLKEE